MRKKEYLKIVKEETPKENNKKDYLKSFLMGGLIGIFAEAIKLLIVELFDIPINNAISFVLLIFIFLSCLLTSLGFFDDIVAKFKCGIIIPITGFAHSIMSCALDYKTDGMINGLGSNFFKLAGSVILYGIVSAFICALIKVIIYA